MTGPNYALAGNRLISIQTLEAVIDLVINLRVDEHDHPVAELRRLYGIAEEIMIPLKESLPTPDTETGSFTFQRSAIGKDGVTRGY